MEQSDIEASTNFSKVGVSKPQPFWKSTPPYLDQSSSYIWRWIWDSLVFTLRTGVEITGGYYITYVEYRGAKTITIHDAIQSLRRLGAPIYGFDTENYHATKKSQEG
ncbi:hypothetical protein K4K57_004939 [Colletotrichum sp. SAR 10_99]|nr:hypothetical protein K4K55_004939 [Colletotrichum sp. SAR 10_96]KAJ5011951.1 hypothetical protein K4K57_004939 [Colletotrichum sp. SAR 10_99]